MEGLVNAKPIFVSCGNNHSLALMSKELLFSLNNNLGNGEVYSWGNNENGQCGTGGSPYNSMV